MLKSMSQEECDAFNEPYWGLLAVAKHLSTQCRVKTNEWNKM